MTDPATSTNGVALNLPTHGTAPLEGSARHSNYVFAREPDSWNSAPRVAAMTTEVPERRSA
jgi:hypothetical protein